MKSWQLALAVSLLALAGCDTPDREAPIVEIRDTMIDDDTCDTVYHYAMTVGELGRAEFRINGHLWRSYSPLVSDDARLVAEFSTSGYTSREDVIGFLGDEQREKLFFWINLDAREPAQKLFLLMDIVEESGMSCWINPASDAVESTVRIYAPPETEAEQ
ncbi:MAG: hypothetical protein KA250_08805 [Verrucomicrobiales bacterium]|nr:hypothetical protein [Verrucomicrobiales bacterium]MBP9225453.1 hypothetical protein [Verrucomicrobiales bacterium]